MLRKLLSLIAAPVMAGGFVVPAFAQQSAQPATRPATQEELFTYNRMGAVNICYLTSQDVPLSKAFPSSKVMIGNVIIAKHGSEIVENNKTIKLEPKQIETGAIFGLVGNVKALCADKLKGNDKKEFDALYSQIEKALKQQQR